MKNFRCVDRIKTRLRGVRPAQNACIGEKAPQLLRLLRASTERGEIDIRSIFSDRDAAMRVSRPVVRGYSLHRRPLSPRITEGGIRNQQGRRSAWSGNFHA